MQKRIYIIAAVILLVGLGSAVSIYLTAENASDNVFGYRIENDGTVYQVNPEDTRAYSHSLELYGGKANLLVDEFRQWFVGLWLGRSLAYTIACITVMIVLGLVFVAHHRNDDERNSR